MVFYKRYSGELETASLELWEKVRERGQTVNFVTSFVSKNFLRCGKKVHTRQGAGSKDQRADDRRQRTAKAGTQ